MPSATRTVASPLLAVLIPFVTIFRYLFIARKGGAARQLCRGGNQVGDHGLAAMGRLTLARQVGRDAPQNPVRFVSRPGTRNRRRSQLVSSPSTYLAGQPLTNTTLASLSSATNSVAINIPAAAGPLALRSVLQRDWRANVRSRHFRLDVYHSISGQLEEIVHADCHTQSGKL
jgi:hypothetical protein